MRGAEVSGIVPERLSGTAAELFAIDEAIKPLKAIVQPMPEDSAGREYVAPDQVEEEQLRQERAAELARTLDVQERYEERMVGRQRRRELVQVDLRPAPGEAQHLTLIRRFEGSWGQDIAFDLFEGDERRRIEPLAQGEPNLQLHRHGTQLVEYLIDMGNRSDLGYGRLISAWQVRYAQANGIEQIDFLMTH